MVPPSHTHTHARIRTHQWMEQGNSEWVEKINCDFSYSQPLVRKIEITHSNNYLLCGQHTFTYRFMKYINATVSCSISWYWWKKVRERETSSVINDVVDVITQTLILIYAQLIHSLGLDYRKAWKYRKLKSFWMMMTKRICDYTYRLRCWLSHWVRNGLEYIDWKSHPVRSFALRRDDMQRSNQFDSHTMYDDKLSNCLCK